MSVNVQYCNLVLADMVKAQYPVIKVQYSQRRKEATRKRMVQLITFEKGAKLLETKLYAVIYTVTTLRFL